MKAVTSPPPPLSFAGLLKRHRREQGLSQQELGLAASYTSAYVSMLERGERVPLATTAEHLAAALQLTQEDAGEFYAAARRAANLFHERGRARRAAALDGAGADGPLLPVGGLLGARPEDPLVARATELAALDDAVEAVLRGLGRVVTLVGEPGVGKTRLAQEVTLRARAAGMFVATGCCYEQSGTVALSPFADALAHLYTCTPPATGEAARQRWPEVTRLLLDRLPAATRQQGTAPMPSMSMTDGQQRLFWQVSGFVRELAEIRPVAMLLDDLHWADEASLDLLQHLARQTRGARVLLLGTYRSTEMYNRRALRVALHELRRERLLEQFTLHSLAADDTAALLIALLGRTRGEDTAGGRVAEALVEQVQQATGGLPLFVQEVLRSLQERGEIEMSDGQWTWRPPGSGELEVPDTVREAIGERIERLRPETQAILQQASVLGQVFAVGPLQRMGTQAEAEVEATLEEALQAGLIEETAQSGAHGAAFSFRHALRQRAVYLSIPSPRRRRLHRAAGEALEAVHEGVRSLSAATLAWHFLEGDAVARALPYTLEAGDEAEAIYAHAEAEKQYRLAVELAHELGDRAREAEVLEKLARLFDILARREEAVACAERAVDLRRASGNLDELAWASGILARIYNRSGRYTEGATLLWRLLLLLAGNDDDASTDRPPDLAGAVAEHALQMLSPRVAARLSISLSVYCTCPPICRVHDALRAIGRAITFAHTAGDGKLEAEARMIRGATLFNMGLAREGTAATEQALSLAEAAGAHDPLVVASLNLVSALCESGDLTAAKYVLRRRLQAAEQLGDIEYLGMLRFNTAEIAFIEGDWRRARVDIEHVGATLPAIDVLHALAAARLELVAGERTQAVSALEAVLASYVEGEDPQHRHFASELLAESALLAGRPDEALGYVSSLPRDDEQPWFAGVHALQAWALAESGDDEAAEHLLAKVLDWATREERRTLLANALRIQAVLALRKRAWREAEEALGRAVELARAIPYPYAEAKARYVYGQLGATLGEHAQAREQFTSALEILGRLGERLYAGQVERAMAEMDGELRSDDTSARLRI